MGAFEGSSEVVVAEKSPVVALEKKDLSLRNVRAEIIRDVLSSGLKSSKKLTDELRPYLRSHDPIVFGDETQPHIDGVIIRPTGDPEKLKQEFYDSLYWSCAALPTVAERSYPDDFLLAGSASKRRNYWGPITAEKKKIITQRLRSSFLVIADLERERGQTSVVYLLQTIFLT